MEPLLNEKKGLEFKSHEAEDVTNIPDELTSPNELLTQRSASGTETPPLPEMFRALKASRDQGKRPVQLKEQKDLELLCILSRQKSFEQDDKDGLPLNNIPHEEAVPWHGPDPQDMAVAGWFRTSPKNAQCAYCKVTKRNWSSTDNPWFCHKHYSPYCARLRQVGDAGVHESPHGKRQLRHSFSSIYDLSRSS